MEQQNVSARELGRRLSPQAPENGRRMVTDYLSPTDPVLPKRKRRRELAVLLGLEADALDDDEEQMASAIALRLMPSLVEGIADALRELGRRDGARTLEEAIAISTLRDDVLTTTLMSRLDPAGGTDGAAGRIEAEAKAAKEPGR